MDTARSRSLDGFELLTLSVVESGYGSRCVYLGDYRIAGGKPYGGGQTVASFVVSVPNIRAALAEAEGQANAESVSGPSSPSTPHKESGI